MERIGVLLVSEQAIPNVLFLREFGPFDRLIFVSTESMEKKRKVEATLDAAGLTGFPKSALKSVSVQEDSMADIKEKIGDTVRSWCEGEHDILVNLTGGTKVMSLAAYEFFSAYGGKIYYLPIGKNQAMVIFPGALSGKTVAIKTRLKVAEYLAAHSVKPTIHGINTNHLALSGEVLAKYSKNSDFRATLKNVAVKLRDFRKERAISVDEDLKKGLNQLGLFVGSAALTQDQIKFLTGDWLELAVFKALSAIVGASIGEVVGSTHIFIRKGGPDNELDVVAVVNNTLFTVECKTAMDDTIISNSIYKIQALRKELGLNCRAVLASCDEKLIDEKRKKSVYDRAGMFGIELVNREEMSSQEVLQAKFKRVLGIG